MTDTDDVFDVYDLLTTKPICNMPCNVMEISVRKIINVFFSFEDFPVDFFKDEERMSIFLFDFINFDIHHVVQRALMRKY